MMKKLLIILTLALAMHVCTLGQDSISDEFAVLYNQFRKESGLSILEYSLELEAFAKERLRVSIEGTRECYYFGNWKTRCPNRDMHFKFSPMAQQHNANPDKKIYVITENIAYDGEFTYSKKPIFTKPKKNALNKIAAFITSLIEPEEITIEYSDTTNNENVFEYKIVSYKPIDEIARYYFQAWLDSEGHKRNFMRMDLTDFAFSYTRTQINGCPYIQALWIGGKKK